MWVLWLPQLFVWLSQLFFVGVELSENPVVLSRLFVLVAVGALVYFC